MLKKTIAIILSLFVLSLTPVMAISSGDIYIAANKYKIKQGQWVTFFTNIDVTVNEEFRVHHLSFIIKDRRGNEVENCHFRSDGSIISGCDNIKKIKPLRGKYNKYWGYHYGQKDMWFKITVDTEEFRPNRYKAYQWARVLTKSGDDMWFGARERFRIVESHSHKKPKKTK